MVRRLDGSTYSITSTDNPGDSITCTATPMMVMVDRHGHGHGDVDNTAPVMGTVVSLSLAELATP